MPGYFKKTEANMVRSLCKAYNLKPADVDNLKMSDVIIYNLVIEQDGFLDWYLTKDN